VNQALDRGRPRSFRPWQKDTSGRQQDLNNSSSAAIANYLLEKTPFAWQAGCQPALYRHGQAIVDYRDKQKGGVLNSIDRV